VINPEGLGRLAQFWAAAFSEQRQNRIRNVQKEGVIVHKHQTILGSIFLAFGLLHVIGIIVLMTIFGFGTVVLFAVGAHEQNIPELVKFIPAGFGLFISFIVALTGIPNLIAAYALFSNRPWGMTAALIVGIFNLPHVPFGTAAGIYAIWVYANFSNSYREANQRVVVT
jgi:hypothetical protein